MVFIFLVQTFYTFSCYQFPCWSFKVVINLIRILRNFFSFIWIQCYDFYFLFNFSINYFLFFSCFVFHFFKLFFFSLFKERMLGLKIICLWRTNCIIKLTLKWMLFNSSSFLCRIYVEPWILYSLFFLLGWKWLRQRLNSKLFFLFFHYSKRWFFCFFSNMEGFKLRFYLVLFLFNLKKWMTIIITISSFFKFKVFDKGFCHCFFIIFVS